MRRSQLRGGEAESEENRAKKSIGQKRAAISNLKKGKKKLWEEKEICSSTAGY